MTNAFLAWDSFSLNRKSGSLWAAGTEKVNFFSLPLVMTVRQLSGDVMDQYPGCWEWILSRNFRYRLWVSALCISWGFTQQKSLQSSVLKDWEETKKPPHFRSELGDPRAFSCAYPELLKNGRDYRELKSSKCRKKQVRERESGKTI